MQSIDKRIIDFIDEHHVLTLATCAAHEPYCANMFYVYIEDENVFVLASDSSTRHIADVVENSAVAASIVLETETIGSIRGLQLQGVLQRPADSLKRKARRAYLRRFPYAVLRGAPLWVVRPTFLKFTDNRLGFGKKIEAHLP
jgi:uncharacterized protein YhbP (UPF0306 family)